MASLVDATKILVSTLIHSATNRDTRACTEEVMHIARSYGNRLWEQDTDGQSIGASSFTHMGTISIYSTSKHVFLFQLSSCVCCTYARAQSAPPLFPICRKARAAYFSRRQLRASTPPLSPHVPSISHQSDNHGNHFRQRTSRTWRGWVNQVLT